MRIKQAIKESGSSVGELAQKMGVARQTISRQINGANITVETVQKIADALGLPVGQLFDQTPQPTKADHSHAPPGRVDWNLAMAPVVVDQRSHAPHGRVDWNAPPA